MNKDAKTKVREPFFIVPSRVFDLELTPYEISVLFYLMMRADNEKHTCFPSVNAIAEGCRMSERKAREVLHTLEEKEVIRIDAKYAPTKKNFNRQTANHYTLNVYGIPSAQKTVPHGTSNTPPRQEMHIPPAPPAEEINKTIPNITTSNISITTEPKSETVAKEEEKDTFSFLKIKDECLDILKNGRGFSDENISILERALQYLWFSESAEYEGKKYTQRELRQLMCERTAPDILEASVRFLEGSRSTVHSPVPYLGKCILGCLINGVFEYKQPDACQSPTQQTDDGKTFDLDDFFALALKRTYGDM